MLRLATSNAAKIERACLIKLSRHLTQLGRAILATGERLEEFRTLFEIAARKHVTVAMPDGKLTACKRAAASSARVASRRARDSLSSS
jgi:hypothetical protein